MFFIPKIKKNFYMKDDKYHFSYCLSWFGFSWGHSDIIYRPTDQPNVSDLTKSEISKETFDTYLAVSEDNGWTWDFALLPPDDTEVDGKIQIDDRMWYLLQVPEQGSWKFCTSSSLVFAGISGDTIITTKDGITWDNTKLTVSDSWDSFKYVGGVFVATGKKYIVFSSDAKEWRLAERK